MAQVADALASLLHAAAEQQPLGLLIDDAQWADGATLAALRAVWSRDRKQSLALVLTVESAARLTPELQALVGSVGREIPGAQIRLDPLASEDVVALTEAMAPWCTATEDRERLARRIAQESAGNPFLAVTLLRDLGDAVPHDDPRSWPQLGATYDSTLPVTISGAVRSAIVARAARLDEDSTAVLRVTSVAGEVLDAHVVAEVSGLPSLRVEAALDRLERERFIAFDGTRYAFNGRLLPAVIESECMQAGGRGRVRERWTAALAARDDIDSQLLRAHLLTAQRHPEAFEAGVRVAERALAIGARRTASRALRDAERVGVSSPDQRLLLEQLRRRLE